MNTIVRTSERTRTPRLIQLRPGSMSGAPLIFAESFKYATIEPVNVTAPMKIPSATSPRWKVSIAGDTPYG